MERNTTGVNNAVNPIFLIVAILALAAVNLILGGGGMRRYLSIGLVMVATALGGCGQEVKSSMVAVPQVDNEKLAVFIEKIVEQQVYVEGGKYLMGDFGAEYGPEKIQYDANVNSKPLHEVELSSFSISKFKVTNEEYDFYLMANQMPLVDIEGEGVDYKYFMLMRSEQKLPAHVDWYEAEKYCSWLGAVSGLPFSLPTEAQWEYAARSRGKFLAVATDDGTYKITDGFYNRDGSGGPQGINISTTRDRKEFAKALGWKVDSLISLPVDQFPPNPLGLYAMSDNGFEWVSDWYDPDYYRTSPVLNPQGPPAPVYKGEETANKYAKVMRGVDVADARWGGGFNVRRRYSPPDATTKNLFRDKDIRIITDKTARCVINSPVPVSRD
ncbi:formylglycine-generating enzyme family protein [Pseudomonas fluorescens]|uniref:formylglycine-generating enzyme family protein n=1 Tax=Pseudomonas fluorescens TaxID=294 RepID=UPI0020C530D9|nr:SUMF1/EgtB/PvdO family nonheme iron enzyme [Pseudomonas fluorescens]UTL92853.1 formylglycine-generating enzyme family protein [Pseudomonas fluorescens]